MWSHPLAREIAWLVAVKLVLLSLIYLLWFSPNHRSPVDPDRVASRLLNAAPTNGAQP